MQPSWVEVATGPLLLGSLLPGLMRTTGESIGSEDSAHQPEVWEA